MLSNNKSSVVPSEKSINLGKCLDQNDKSKLNLSHSDLSTLNVDELMAFLKQHNEITKIDLSYCYNVGAFLDALKTNALEPFHSITELTMVKAKLSKDSIEYKLDLAKLVPYFPQLTILNISSYDKIKNTAELKKLSKLEKLDVNSSNLTHPDADNISKLYTLTQLQILNNNLEREGIEKLAAQSNLKGLNCSSRGITELKDLINKESPAEKLAYIRQKLNVQIKDVQKIGLEEKFNARTASFAKLSDDEKSYKSIEYAKEFFEDYQKDPTATICLQYAMFFCSQNYKSLESTKIMADILFIQGVYFDAVRYYLPVKTDLLEKIYSSESKNDPTKEIDATDYVKVAYKLGVCYQEMAVNEEAIANFNDVIRLSNPESPSEEYVMARYLRAKIYLSEATHKDYSMVISDFSGILQYLNKITIAKEKSSQMIDDIVNILKGEYLLNGIDAFVLTNMIKDIPNDYSGLENLWKECLEGNTPLGKKLAGVDRNEMLDYLEKSDHKGLQAIAATHKNYQPSQVPVTTVAPVEKKSGFLSGLFGGFGKGKQKEKTFNEVVSNNHKV